MQEQPPTSRWQKRALYTYEDDSDDLTLASTGDGGIEEITLTFDSGHIMYGFCSLKEPNSALPHYILINWVGEDVPDARKCTCASHVATIAEFFQGVDVVVNASSIDDVDPVAIAQRLTNGAAPVASPVLSRLRTRDEEGMESVGTCYQKTNAELEMKKLNREEFWEKAKREEEMRKEEERRKMAEERRRFEEERMALERREQEERERRYRERERQIEEHRRKMLAQEEEEARERMKALISEGNREGNQEKKDSEVEPEEEPVPFPSPPIQNVAPQVHREPAPSGNSQTRPQETDSPPDLWETSSDEAQARPQAQSRPHPLLSFEETTEGLGGDEDNPSSLVDIAGPHQMTLSYQHALQSASGTDSQELDDGHLLLTNGDSLLKEGTQASEGYFSQSQEEDFAQSDDCSSKETPMPVLYNKPPEIDITCWDADPVTEEDEYGVEE
ncbi:hypothetical protein JZ751_020132 [Albula glossodonta]|uniref:Drebrin n=1 Tax=Albula glossodonta TaxID=121402 RepID=A0A8T2NL27_9TELE|nr:hypothetical protein JZ751_020132 [Albula glossodonta]